MEKQGTFGQLPRCVAVRGRREGTAWGGLLDEGKWPLHGSHVFVKAEMTNSPDLGIILSIFISCMSKGSRHHISPFPQPACHSHSPKTGLCLPPACFYPCHPWQLLLEGLVLLPGLVVIRLFSSFLFSQWLTRPTFPNLFSFQFLKHTYFASCLSDSFLASFRSSHPLNRRVSLSLWAQPRKQFHGKHS